MNFDPVWFFVALALAAVGYAVWTKHQAGVQPGEDLVDRLIEAMHSHSVTQTSALSQILPAAIARAIPQPAPAPAAVAPSPAPAPSIAASPPPPAAPVVVLPAASAAPGAGTPAKVTSDWPRAIQVGGATIMAKAPINPLWQASTVAVMLGGQGSYVADPSNGDQADPPMPLRSAIGMPIVYTLVGKTVVGTGTIPYGDQSFNSDAEVLDYARRIAERNANLAQWQAGENALATLQPGQLDVTTLGVDDLCFLFRHWSELFGRVGPRPAANLAINWVGGQSSTKPWPNLPDTPPDVYRWDDSTYAGPLRALIS